MEVFFVSGTELEGQWRELFAESEGARVQHSLEWKKCVEAAYPQLQSGYLLVEEKEENVLGLPAFFAKSFLFGDRSISLPFVDYGGFIGSPTQSRAAIAFSKMRARFGCDGIEVRLSGHSPGFPQSEKALFNYGFDRQSTRQLAVVQLEREEKMWDGFDKHTRNDVRKAEKSGLQLKQIDSQKELSTFYELYFTAMKGFGSPQHPPKFFEALYSNLSAKKMFYGWNCYSAEGQLAGSLIMLFHNNYANVAYNISSPSFRQYRPNDLLYWTALEKASEMGAESLDLGQVKQDAGPGSHARGILDYKLKWGAKLFEKPFYHFGYGEGKTSGTSGGDGKFRHLQKIWRKLPDAVVRKIGPWVSRQLGA